MSDKIREALEAFLDLGIEEKEAAKSWPELAHALSDAREALAHQPAKVVMSDEQAAFEQWRSEQIAALERMGYPDAATAFRNLGSVQWAGWQARAMLAAAPAAPVAVGQELPCWEPCNPACDPELNGFLSKRCDCAQAKAALAAPPAAEQPDTIPVNREMLEHWANDLALNGVGDIDTAAQIDALLSGGDKP